VQLHAVIALVLTAAAGLLVGCGTPIRMNGVEVDKDMAFLAVVEQQWRGDERGGADPHASSAENTGCWVARNPKSGAAQAAAYCGPIRHLSGETPDGVFDQLTFRPEFLSDRQVQVDPETVELTAVGVPAPSGLQLYSPRAGKPADPDDVPAPEVPRADAGLVTTVDDSLIENATVPTSSSLIAPNLRVSISKTGSVTHVPSGEGDSVPYYQPAEGEEFLAFTVRRTVLDMFDEGYLTSTGRDLSATYTVRSSGILADLTSWFADDTDGDATVVLSVPAGQDAELTVSVDGLEQTLDVRTGDRTSTVAEAYYRPQTSFAIEKQYSDSVRKGDFNLQHGVTFKNATLTPFDPSRGWAPTGQMYLILDCDNVLLHKDADAYGYADPSFNSKTSVTATNAAKGKVQLLDGFPSDLEGDLDALTFLVPVDAEVVQIRYQPKGTFAIDNLWSPDDFSPDRGSFTFKPVQLEVKLR
jgi:hypothetical protein